MEADADGELAKQTGKIDGRGNKILGDAGEGNQNDHGG